MNFLDALLRTINFYRVMPIGAIVDVDAFRALPENMRAFVSGAAFRHTADIPRNLYTLEQDITRVSVDRPYYGAFSRLLVEAEQYARKDALVRIIMDTNDNHEASARSNLNSMRDGGDDAVRIFNRISGLSFERDELHPGIQAADMYTNVMRTQQTGPLPTTFYERAYEALTQKRGSVALMDAAEFQRIRTLGEQALRVTGSQIYGLLRGPQRAQ